jgi:hypothetical protein
MALDNSMEARVGDDAGDAAALGHRLELLQDKGAATQLRPLAHISRRANRLPIGAG